jgi:two-component system sensor histidine kinase KdpD
VEGIDEKLPEAAGNREGWEMKKNDIDEMDKKRDPEKILQEIKEQEEEQEETGIKRRGKLKIFFGYAAGVGKTYAMLDTAGEAKAAGADVVAGYIEPHARPDSAFRRSGGAAPEIN